MLKMFLIVTGFILVVFLAMDDSYNFSIRALGYEFTFSIALLIVGIVLFFYVLHLIKKPFGWLRNYHIRRFQKNIVKKENFLTYVLTTILDKNDLSIQTIYKKEKSLFAKGTTQQLLLEALFSPSDSVFEMLKNKKETELAGMRGLFLSAKQKGDIDTQNQILEVARNLYPHVLWILQQQLELQLLQNDWQNALETIEKLHKHNGITQDDYRKKRACILFSLSRFKEAFSLTPENPMMAWAYAQSDPHKAEDILKESWNNTPSWQTYELYYNLIKNENSARQMKLIEKFTAKNPSSKLSLLAVSDTAMKNHLWGVAKETLQSALNAYETTKQMAEMMAFLERNGWHHEEAAREWDQKALSLGNVQPWTCQNCNHTSSEWTAACPICNMCGQIMYHVE